MTTKKTANQEAVSSQDLDAQANTELPKLVGTTQDNKRTYELPSGARVSLRMPTILDLEQIEEYQLEYPGRSVKHVRLTLEHLGVDNIGELPPSDFSALSALLADFLG